MCGVTLKDGKSCEELRQRLGIDSVSDVLRRNRLRWFSHGRMMMTGLKHVRDWRLVVGEVEAGVRRVERMCCGGYEGTWVRAE